MVNSVHLSMFLLSQISYGGHTLSIDIGPRRESRQSFDDSRERSSHGSYAGKERTEVKYMNERLEIGT